MKAKRTKDEVFLMQLRRSISIALKAIKSARRFEKRAKAAEAIVKGKANVERKLENWLSDEESKK